MKRTVKLSGRELRRMISESVRKICEEYYPVNANSFVKDDRIAAKGYTNKSVNMPWPEHDDVSPYSKYKGDYYAPVERDGRKMYKDITNLRTKEKNVQKAADNRWKKAADSRPLHGNNSLNRTSLDEEVDMGQIRSANEKREERKNKSPREEEIRKKISSLRRKIGDYEEEGKDTSELTREIQRLKKDAGYNTVENIISESVRKISESEMPILHSEGNGEVYRDDAFVTDWRDNPNDDPNKVKAPYNSYVWNKKFSKYYPTPESFWNPKDTRAYKYTRDLDKIHSEEDKFKKSEDLKTQRALDAADSRPLHRKGSLNRVGMDENVISKLVSESIKKVLNEKWYPEEDDDISDYFFGMTATLTTSNDLELDDETISKLENIKDEYIDYDVYTSVMVQNVNVSCDQYGECSLTINCAISAPEMPISEIEEETEEALWYWVEEVTGKPVLGFEWESEETVFDYRSRYK